MTTFAPSAVNHPIQPDNLKTTSLHNIDELTWLIVSNNIQPTIITLNETNNGMIWLFIFLLVIFTHYFTILLIFTIYTHL